MAQRCSEYVGQKGIVEMPKEQTDAPVKFLALDRRTELVELVDLCLERFHRLLDLASHYHRQLRHEIILLVASVLPALSGVRTVVVVIGCEGRQHVGSSLFLL